MSIHTTLLTTYGQASRWLDQRSLDLVLVLMRLVVGTVFFQSALTKVDGVGLADSTFFLFEHEYALPLISPVLAAYLATLAEFSLSLLLWAGLATRLAATGLLIMTLVIQTFVYPEAWVTHGLWRPVWPPWYYAGRGCCHWIRCCADSCASGRRAGSRSVGH